MGSPFPSYYRWAVLAYLALGMMVERGRKKAAWQWLLLELSENEADCLIRKVDAHEMGLGLGLMALGISLILILLSFSRSHRNSIPRYCQIGCYYYPTPVIRVVSAGARPALLRFNPLPPIFIEP